jgi:hypothetical protein
MDFKAHHKLEDPQKVRTELGFEVIALLVNYFNDEKPEIMTAEWCMETLKKRYFELVEELQK